MARASMTSKERILAAIRHEPVDYIPLCFEGVGHPWAAFLVKRYPDPLRRAEFFLGLGLDTGVVVQPPRFSLETFELNEWATRPYPDMEVDSAVVPQPALGLDPGYRVRTWSEQPADEPQPLLCAEYATPGGTVRQVVRLSEYPYRQVSLTNDLNLPASRSKEHLIQKEEDLEALEHILRPPAGAQLDPYYRKMKEARAFCDAQGILLSGRSQGVGDVLFWLSGPETVLYLAVDKPDVLRRYIEIVSRWNRSRIQIQIDAGADLIIRRGWYEGCDFWSPDLYRRFLAAPLKREIEMLHAAGRYMTYVMNSGAVPLLPQFRELGFDVLSDIDPRVPGTDLKKIKAGIGDRIALYGGVNNYDLIERGTPEAVRQAVFEAVEAMGPAGFILGPGDTLDCLLEFGPTTEKNFYAMIEAWKACRDSGA
jgi:hypothetical protein